MSQTGYYNSFGPGLLCAKGLATGSQPIVFGSLQDVQIKISAKNDLLMGQNQFASAVGRGSITIKGTAKIGALSLSIYELMFGGAASVGTTSVAYAEAHSVPAATPYTVTVTNSATFVADYGVVYTSTGIPLQLVASNPTQGQYSVSAGVYTFAAADASAAVQITYTYTSSTFGGNLQVANGLQGVQPVFGILAQRSWNGTGERIVLPYCIASDLTLPTAMSKFGIGQFDFDAFSQGGTASPIQFYSDI